MYCRSQVDPNSSGELCTSDSASSSIIESAEACVIAVPSDVVFEPLISTHIFVAADPAMA